MTIRFDDRVAIVTGAGTGLGRAHARMLAAHGASVVVNDLGEGAQAVAAEIRAEGGRAVACPLSVAEPDSAAEIVATAIREFGRIDIVLNNAGILRDKSFARMALADFDLVVKVHLLGTAYVTHAAWPHLLAQGYGRVVLTSSASGLANSFGQANYAAAKAGMVGLMNSLKNEGRKSGVLVNTLVPVALTQMTEGLLSPRMAEVSRPEHVSPAACWLCSEACDVTGEILAAGGGYYTTIKVMKGPGVLLDPDVPAGLDAFAAVRDQVFDLTAAAPYQATFDAATKARMGIE